jgi:MFS family permease
LDFPRLVLSFSSGEVNRDAQPLWPAATLIALTGLNLFDYLDRQLLGAVLTPLKNELLFADRQLGWLQSAFMLGYFLTAPIFGYLGDRWPRRVLVAAGVFVWSLGTLMTGHGNGIVSLILFRVLVGFGEASFGTISPGWIADLFPAPRRNTAISIFYLAIPVGSALGYVLGSTIAAHYGWRSAFLWAGYPGLLLAATLFFFREPARGASEHDAHSTGDHVAVGWQAYFSLLLNWRYVLVVAGYAAQTFALGGFALWAPTFLYRVHHMSFESAGQFFGGTLVVTGLIATLAGGLAATAWQRRRPDGFAWMLALSALAAAPVSFAAFLLDGMLAAQLALAGAMLLLFLPTGPINTLILETVPVRQRATAMAASIFAIHCFGDLWSPSIVGWLSDRYGSLQRAVLLLPFALIVSASLWLVLAIKSRPRHDVASSPVSV